MRIKPSEYGLSRESERERDRFSVCIQYEYVADLADLLYGRWCIVAFFVCPYSVVVK